MKTTTWRTLWQHNDIVVYRDEVEVDRLPAESIHRVYFVYRGLGNTPGDIAHSVVELAGDAGYALFEPNTGFAGRVNFERHVVLERAPLRLLGRGAGRRPALAAAPCRLARRVGGPGVSTCGQGRAGRQRRALASSKGPQTWAERKNRRIERSRPFGYARGAHA